MKLWKRHQPPIGRIDLPYASNTCFGGTDFTELFITSADKFLGIKTKVQGVKPLPLRKK